MNREIKFRAWNSLQNRYDQRFPLELKDFGDLGYTLTHKYNGFIFQQYTGLKDKNGKEIYEGDICFVKRPNTFFSKGENMIVEYNENNCCFMYKYNRSDWNWCFGNSGHYLIGKNNGNSTVCEIIGNIYENPNLLK